mmetsp:Transcript_8177/g.20892  ORF Transcript_8177/g.20892 Transcript_8177/m.20892 type:complete len:949 (-) Transcript_8177:2830-5676(-)|eukprot:CAMPEP_0182928276 /NCGR_PEP_ID=MMETSP0105_2-20130417/15503_1 /TAXON_ID=81532 ORGANISM="Acanthoeca-like sp., Strain 10tr" /NCGR_SAMPLE_ID=MMETSP0105_2 /ASSEMBLY_ACC=CAM_ASM_000205 /LENGTH=948 /DNA_ID=CAMNT_0025066277 /DNA_START=43 /DNA_END=2889 /DNA_ORIENTATION=+
MSGGGGGDVKVVVRFRPQQTRELRQGGGEITKFDALGRGVQMNGQRKCTFTFDRVFNPSSTQEDVYNYAAKPVVEDVLKGYNGTIFAYGQTSSGKTHTMQGPDIGGESRGIIPRIVDDIFGFIEIAPESFEFTVRMSYFEIYMEKIRDLLCDGNANLQIHENRERGVYVRHATELYMQSPEEVLDVLDAGQLRRKVTETNMNDQSSRSHAVVLLELTQQDTEKGGCKTGKLYLVDLAGSEKVSKTGADGTVLDEAKNINKSLSALGLVIMNLTDGNPKAHVPYRDSKLTRILQESLGGNSRTTIVICASPSSWNEQETLSSLNFGKRAKKIKNKAKINVQYSAAELERQLEDARKEIRKLVKTVSLYEEELRIWRSGGTVSEADRVNLGSKEAEADGETKGAEATAAIVDSVLSEEERENFMYRESELLDLLDDKDEEIRQLEKEVQSLGEKRVTITKLAGENQSLKEQKRTQDTLLEQFEADAAEYMENIEELVRVNDTMDQDYKLLETEKEALQARIAKCETDLKAQIKLIAEELNGLPAAKSGGRQLPKLPGSAKVDPLVEGPLQKARRYIIDLQAAEAKAKESESMVSQEKAAKLEAELQGKIEYETLRVEQVTTKLNSAIAAKNAAESKVEQLNEQCAKVIAMLMEYEEKEMDKSEASGDAEAAEELKIRREAQFKEQIDDQQMKLKEVTEELKAVRDSKEQLAEDRNSMALTLKTLEADRDRLRATADELKAQLDTALKKENDDRQTQALIDAKNVRMSSFQDFKRSKWAEMVEKHRHQLGKYGKENGGVDGVADVRVKSKVDEKLRERLEEVSKLKVELRAVRTSDARAQQQLNEKARANQKLQRQVLAQTTEIRGLKDNLKALETRLKKVMERRRTQTGRLAGGGGRNSRPTISGGGKAAGDSRRADMFRGGSRAGSASASIVPAVAAAAAPDPDAVEYV